MVIVIGPQIRAGHGLYLPIGFGADYVAPFPIIGFAIVIGVIVLLYGTSRRR
jgi:hypothetical protein